MFHSTGAAALRVTAFLACPMTLLVAGCGGASGPTETTPAPVTAEVVEEPMTAETRALIDVYAMMQAQYGEDIDAQTDEGYGYYDETAAGEDTYEEEADWDEDETMSEEDRYEGTQQAVDAELKMDELRLALEDLRAAHALIEPGNVSLATALQSAIDLLQEERDAWPAGQRWTPALSTANVIEGAGEEALQLLAARVHDWVLNPESPANAPGACGAVGVALHVDARDLWVNLEVEARGAESYEEEERQEFTSYQDEELSAVGAVISALDEALDDGLVTEEEIEQIMEADTLAEPETYLDEEAYRDFVAAYDAMLEREEGPFLAPARRLWEAAIALRDGEHPDYVGDGEALQLRNAAELTYQMRRAIPRPGPRAITALGRELVSGSADALAGQAEQLRRLIAFSERACAAR